jgi:hypothetical protein
LNPARFEIAGVELRLHADDRGLEEELAAFFGGAGVTPPYRALEARVLAADGIEGRLQLDGDDLAGAAEHVIGMDAGTGPLVRGEPDGRGPAVAIEGEREPLFVFGDGVVHFRKVSRWRRILAHFLFLRALRLRHDALFFHAASVSLGGRGALIVGAKGAGKTTLALAVGARGGGVLGDETAAYVPHRRSLLPMRRPARIKAGPRARGVQALLSADAYFQDEEERIKAPLDRLFPSTPDAAPLHAVVFLRGFSEIPRIEGIAAGRAELRSLQPLGPTLHGGSARRVFDMVAMLAGVHCFRARIGDPDESAAALEATLARMPGASGRGNTLC